MLPKRVALLSSAVLTLFIVSQVSEAIINGKIAKRGQFPYAVALYLDLNGEHVFFCTGSLISQNAVMTAGHCVNVKNHGPLNATYYYGILGVVDRNSTKGTKIFFKSATPHPKFSRHPIANDISILITTEPVSLNENIQPVCIAKDDTHLNEYKRAVVCGWGKILKNGTYKDPEYLRYVRQHILNAKECGKVLKESYGEPRGLATHKQVCGVEIKKAAEEGIMTGTCFGDSGGPLVHEGKKKVQIGITSYGDGDDCGKEASAFTRVSAYIDFIRETAGPDAGICYE